MKTLIAVVLALTLAVSCGGGDRNEAGPKSQDPCPDKVEFTLGNVPKGFSSTPEKGPAAGLSTVKNAAMWHVNGPEGKYIEVFRGSRRTLFTNGLRVAVLRGRGVLTRIDNLYALKFRLDEGRCERYQLEARGLTAKEIQAVVAGIKR
jgi:hypothetical protein